MSIGLRIGKGKQMLHRTLKLSLVLCCAMISAGQVTAQTTSSMSAEPEVRRIYNWIHSTAHGELTFPFYRDMLDIKLVRSPFAGSPPADAPAPQIRPVSEAVSDPLIWHLTDSEGSRFRNVFMHSANEDFGLELSEFFDIPRNERAVSPYDPGASRIIFHVRDLDEVVNRMQLVNTPVVTLGWLSVTAFPGFSSCHYPGEFARTGHCH